MDVREKLYTTKEAAEFLKDVPVSIANLVARRARKTIPDYIITKANRVFYKHEELSRFKDSLQKVVFVNNSQQKNKTRKA